MSYMPGAERAANKGQPNGFAGLDSNGLLDLSQVQTFVAAGTGHRAGLVPDPGSVAQARRFMIDTGQWSYTIGAIRSLVELVNQTAAIGSTPLVSSVDHGTGMFRAAIYLAVQVAGTSGNVTLAVSWADLSGTTQTLSYDTPVTPSGGKVNQFIAFQLGASSAFSYATSFSATPGSVQYYLKIAIDKVIQP